MARKDTLLTQLEKILQQNVSETYKAPGTAPKKPGVACSAVMLSSVDGVNHHEEVYSWPLAGNIGIAELAEEIKERADNSASGSSEKSKFVLSFFYGSDKPQRPYTFWIASAVALGEHGVEEATAKGLVKAMAQEKNHVLQLCFEQINVMNSLAKEMVETATNNMRQTQERLDSTEAERNVLIEMMVQERVARMSKEHEYRMEELARQDKNEDKRALLTMAPALVNTVLKKNVFPEATGDSSLLKGALASMNKMNPELVMAFLGGLPEPLAAALMQRGMQMKAEEDERIKKNAEAVQAAGNIVNTPETPVEPKPQGLTS